MNIQQFSALPLDQRFRLFVEWLGEQPPNETYNYWECSTCALGRFAKAFNPSPRFVAGATHFATVSDDEAGGYVTIDIMDPHSRGIHAVASSGNFGTLYRRLCPLVGIPRKPFWRPLALRVLARVVKFVNPLAS